ncbi:TPA: hypothetical protein O4A28_002621, partial [Staphylococcus aureus]|nr:hypothetical protein [Staphylococcus aureus]
MLKLYYKFNFATEPKKGYEGKYTILREYCKNKKQNETKKATIRVETNPGIAAQVDWKEDMV